MFQQIRTIAMYQLSETDNKYSPYPNNEAISRIHLR